MYSIEFIESAKREFLKLSKENQKRVASVLERIRVRPYEFALRLSGSRAYRIRVGKLRVILDIKDSNRTIVILKIGERKNVYSP